MLVANAEKCHLPDLPEPYACEMQRGERATKVVAVKTIENTRQRCMSQLIVLQEIRSGTGCEFISSHSAITRFAEIRRKVEV